MAPRHLTWWTAGHIAEPLGWLFALLISVVMARHAGWLLSAAVVTLSLPWWLPGQIVRLRNFLFTAINGADGVQFPNAALQGKQLEWLYNHPAASLRSRQNAVGLSDFFWYLLSPVHYLHQEHVETETPLYPAVTAATTAILRARPGPALSLMAQQAAARVLGPEAIPEWREVRLRDFWFPVFTRLFFELIFETKPDPDTEALLSASGQDVVQAMKGCKVIYK